MSMNSSHYSGWSKRLPLSVTSNLVQRSGSQIYFHPLIPLRSLGYADDLRRIKYGVIAKEDALSDLNEWRTFALAGRTQKSVLTVKDDTDVSDGIQRNREQALALALVLRYHELGWVPFDELMLTLCNFSYKGDIRMRWKMENPQKVRNIVDG